MAADSFSVLGYLIGFWLFIFNRKFREAWLVEFKTENAFSKFFSSIEALSAIVFGLGAPALLAYWLFTK